MSSKKKSRRLALLFGAYLVLVALAGFLMWQRLAEMQKAPPVSPPIENTLPAGEGSVSVISIDVGQGDSTLILTGTHAVLIDGGEYSAVSAVKAALRQAGVTKLDLVILTHPHSDHYGSLRSILRAFPTAEFVTCAVPEDMLPTTSSYQKLVDTLLELGVPCHTAAPGMAWQLDDATLTVLGPTPQAVYDSLNNYSVVTRLTFGTTAFLFPGDAEEPAERDLLASGVPLSATVLKAGHHGSNTSSSTAFLQQVQPQFALLSVGEDNAYGLPGTAALTRLKEAGAALYRTDLQGCLIAVSDGRTVTVTTEK